MQKGSEPIIEHIPLEEVRIEDVDSLDPPQEWDRESSPEEPVPPPVLIEEGGRFTLLAHHDAFWRARAEGRMAVRAVVVRSAVHIPLAHRTVGNSLEEALLFDGLLRSGIVPNRSRLADMLGFSRARITQVLNILKLPLEIRQKLLLAHHVSEFQLRPLIKIEDGRRQHSAFAKLMADGLTGRQMALFAAGDGSGEPGVDLEELVAGAELSGHQEETPPPSGADLPPEGGEPLERARTATRQPASVPGAPAEAGRAGDTSQRSELERMRNLLSAAGTLREAGWEETVRRLGAVQGDMAFLEGVSMLRRGLYQKAVDSLLAAVHTGPGKAASLFFLGRAFNLMDNLARAEESLRSASELVPDDPDIISELAIVLEKQRRFSEASSFYRRASVLRNPGQTKSRRP